MSDFYEFYALGVEGETASLRGVREEIGEGSWDSYQKPCLEMIEQGRRGIETKPYGERSSVDFELEAEPLLELLSNHPAKGRKARALRKILSDVVELKGQRKNTETFHRLAQYLRGYQEMLAELRVL